MNTLYFSCNMGAAGDMLGAALLELFPDRAAALAALNGMGIPGVEYRAEKAVKCGIVGTHLQVLLHGEEEQPAEDGTPHCAVHGSCSVSAHDKNPTGAQAGVAAEHAHAHGQQAEALPEHDHHHAEDPHSHEGHPHVHHSLADIDAVLDGLAAPEAVRADAKAVYRSIADAESRVHGTPVSEVHFHEVGALDAVADVAAVCLLLHLLAPVRICASPIQVGGGTVRCAHGILPVPTPATTLLLEGLPVEAGAAPTELCTPTGAALLRHFTVQYGAMPAMRITRTGRGCGKKDFAAANCVTAYYGESTDEAEAGPMDEVTELRCNLDDMTPEAIGYAQETLLQAGALDVFTTAIGMKKGRPAVLLTVLCRPGQQAAMAAMLLRHTTTLGVRETLCRRYTLRRVQRTADTEWGPVHFKTAQGWGVQREKPEYEDLARIARETGLPLAEVLRRILG